MKIEGTFKSLPRKNIKTNNAITETFKVTITDGNTGFDYNIVDPTENNFNGTARDIYCFSPDPVHISCDRSDLTQLIMVSQAQIKLKVNEDVSSTLFAYNQRQISVTIERPVSSGSTPDIVFFGYVDPLNFDQGYAHNFEEITVIATDPLGALENLTVLDIPNIQATTDWNVPLVDFIYQICKVCFKKSPSLFTGIKTYFSNGIDPNSIMINTSIFYSDDPDDQMTLHEVLEEVLKYIGCTLCYEPKGKKIILHSMYYESDINDAVEEWFNGVDDALDARSSLTMDDAYNKVVLTCDVETSDDEIKLVDDDAMYSDYKNMQKYMTELVSPGKGTSAYEGFADLLKSNDGAESSTNYPDAYRMEHFCYVKRNDAWKFGSNSYITMMNGTEGNNHQTMKGDQSTVLRWLKENPFKAAFVSFGKGQKLKLTDNSPVNNISLTDYLVISVCGHNDQRENGHALTMFSQIQSNSPICTYEGIKSMTLMPTDPTVTNYIVISGKLILNPLQPKTGKNWKEDPSDNDWGGTPPDSPGIMNMLYNASLNTLTEARNSISTQAMFNSLIWTKIVPIEVDGDGGYYQHKWWKFVDNALVDETNPVYETTDTPGIVPILGNKNMEMLSYSYTSVGDANDKISKLPILACQLKVGDKWCVERLDYGVNGQGVFEWMTMDEWKDPNRTSFVAKGFDKPYFTIGIDPKVNDKLVGKQYSIQNNIDYMMNIDASGTAIPITIDDGLNGVPEFSILGPIMQEWNQIERIHPSFWRHTKWNNHKYWTLELLDSIMISDLKIEFKSDNGKFNKNMSNEDNDIVYESTENINFTEKLELDTKICTPLTLNECVSFGTKYKISNSYVMTTDNMPFYGWSYSNNRAPYYGRLKPEVMLIDYYYKQYYKPARIIDTKVNAGYAIGSSLENIDNGDYLGLSSIVSNYVVNMEYPGIITEHYSTIGGVRHYKDDYYCMSIDWGLKYQETSCKFRQKLAYTSPLAQ